MQTGLCARRLLPRQISADYRGRVAITGSDNLSVRNIVRFGRPVGQLPLFASGGQGRLYSTTTGRFGATKLLGYANGLRLTCLDQFEQ